jgi:glycosyltransferase involved in cell wall biosynthesis
LVTVADAMIEQSVTARIALRERFTTIRSGLETDRFAPSAEVRARHRQEWAVGERDIVVGTVARLFQNKGYEEILAAMPEAVRREPRLRFVWVGDGANREDYERRLESLGLRDRVRLLGLLRPEEVASILTGLDMLVHASRWEGLPRAIVQGLLTEVPAISFDNDGAPEVVRTGETGILVALGDVAGLADAVVRMAGDAESRRRMGVEGRRRCLAEFDWRRMVEQLEALYSCLVVGGPGRTS